MRTIPVTGLELHCHYYGQAAPQPCYVALNLGSGVLCASYNGEIGNAVPFAVVHGRTLRWTIPALKADAANSLLAEIAPFAEKLCANYDTTWDGSNNVAVFDAADRAAMDAIQAFCDRVSDDDAIHSCDATDWFASIGSQAQQCLALGITADTSDAELATIEDDADDEADANGCDFIDGLGDYLRRLREGAVERAEAA